MLNTNAVIKALKDEAVLRVRHVALLEAQQRTLLACDREAFCAGESEHGALLAQIDAQAAVRRAALTDEVGKEWTVTDAIESLADGLPRRALTKVRDGLCQSLERARVLTTRNEMLIRNELNYLTFTLELFVDAGRSAGQRYGMGVSLGGRLGLDRRA